MQYAGVFRGNYMFVVYQADIRFTLLLSIL